MEAITVRKKDGNFESTDKSYIILGAEKYSGVGRVLIRASGIYTTFRYNVARIAAEKEDEKT